MLAGVGVSWYTWLEQGRDIRVSNAVLDALSRALRLDETERTHLYRLCDLNPPAVAVRSAGPELARMRRIVDGWSPNPSYVIDSYGNVLTANPMATSIFGVTDQGYNCPVAFFSDELVRERYPEGAEVARRMVAHLRTQAVSRFEDPDFQRLVNQLRSANPEFAELWSRHEIEEETGGVVLFEHPRLGRLTFEQTALKLAEYPDLRLMVYLALPGPDGNLPDLGPLPSTASSRSE